jgi:tRNA-dihydrouridine synthase
MIGRMAPSNPWIFRQIEQYCARVGADAIVRPVERSSTLLEAHGEGQATWPAATPDEGVRGYTSSSTTNLYDHPTEADRFQMIRTYFQMLIEEELPDAIGKMKQFASWFTHGVPGGAALRKGIYESKAAPEVLSRVEDFFEARLLCAANLPRATAEDAIVR